MCRASNHSLLWYKLKRCSKKECCKQCRHVKFNKSVGICFNKIISRINAFWTWYVYMVSRFIILNTEASHPAQMVEQSSEKRFCVSTDCRKCSLLVGWSVVTHSWLMWESSLVLAEYRLVLMNKVNYLVHSKH